MEYEVCPEGDIVNPEDMEVYASAPPSANIGENDESIEAADVTDQQN